MNPHADMRLIPPLPSPWHVCDIDTLLQQERYAELDASLQQALAASLLDREAESKYWDAMASDASPVHKAGAAGLARLREWQALVPASGHAHLIEAYYWFHWAYEYRGSGWAGSVTSQGWCLAHACAARAFIAALRALELEPRLWAAPALMMQVDRTFNTPEWLARLLASGSHPPHRIGADWLALDSAEQDGLHEALQASGLHGEPEREGPTARPQALIGTVQNRKTLSGVRYWIGAVLAVIPTGYWFMRQVVWHMQPRWGGSHDTIRAFLNSPSCAHLSELEKDRLRHEIWRDDYLDMEVDEDDDAADVENWRSVTRERMQAALYPYHRYETGVWLANSHYGRDEHAQAAQRLREAEQHHPVDDDLVMARALWLALQPGLFEPGEGERWVLQVAERSAHAFESQAAMVLLGHCTAHGLLGAPANPALGEAWLEAARQQGPGTMAWNRISSVLAHNGHQAAGYRLAELGHEAGGEACAYLLGLFHSEGIHVQADPRAAIPWFRQTMEEGGNNGAHQLHLMYLRLIDTSSNTQETEQWRMQAIEAARHAHELGHTDGLENMLMSIGDLQDVGSVAHYLPLLREHAEQGHHTAMAALSSLLSNASDKARYDYRESVRWILGAQAIAPDDKYVQNVLRLSHQDGFISRMLFKVTRNGIKPHEIPGVDNRMV